ncbi:MAG: methylene-tetrahydromethanopterin dehydrogenase N-terminal domain-containing protein, partial [Planctomycetaceae bacterium]
MQTILIQLDTDGQASIFDRVVAVDSGVAQIFSCAGVTPENVTSLVHGAIFTRGPADLKNTAIFIGGSSAAAGEAVQKKVLKAFFGPLRVSVMMDSNGCNTTAAAAVATA